jgi:outer membrane protein, multidrug efflux system
LSHRPDVKQAELAVTASQAYQQYAKARMYPSLVISAEAGVNAFKASNWFNLPASLFGAITGSITQPIFQRKELKTQYELARVEQEKNVLIFKQKVISAAGEVSDALISIQKLKEKQKITSDRTTRLKQATKHANLLFETGMATYLEVITAQSNILQSELELAQVKKAELSAVVDLYRSLGGGWSNN